MTLPLGDVAKMKLGLPTPSVAICGVIGFLWSIT